MGLYLTIFDNEKELEGVEVGSYSDFSVFRNAVVNAVEGGKAGSRCPTLILHSDCDGQWTPREAALLEEELENISERFKQLPPIDINSGWQRQVIKTFGLQMTNLYQCFFDVDGEPLLERLLELARLSRERKMPILFQ